MSMRSGMPDPAHGYRQSRKQTSTTNEREAPYASQQGHAAGCAVPYSPKPASPAGPVRVLAFFTLLAAAAWSPSAAAGQCTLTAADFTGADLEWRAGAEVAPTRLAKTERTGSVTLTARGCTLPRDHKKLSAITVTLPATRGAVVVTLSGKVTTVEGEANQIIHYAFHQLQIDHVGEDGTTSAHFDWSGGSQG